MVLAAELGSCVASQIDLKVCKFVLYIWMDQL